MARRLINDTGCAITILLAFIAFGLAIAELITGALFRGDACDEPAVYLLIQGISQTVCIFIGFWLLVFAGAWSGCAGKIFQVLYYANLLFQMIWNIVYMIRTFSGYNWYCLEGYHGSQFYDWFHVALIFNTIYTGGLIIGAVAMCCFEN